jgi:hypothetical protein
MAATYSLPQGHINRSEPGTEQSLVGQQQAHLGN